MATNYQRGRAFEYRTRNACTKLGAVYVMRAAQSKGLADLAAFWPHAEPWLIQCKLDGRFTKKERAGMLDLYRMCDACIPVFAAPGPKGRGVVFTHAITGEVLTSGDVVHWPRAGA